MLGALKLGPVGYIRALDSSYVKNSLIQTIGERFLFYISIENSGCNTHNRNTFNRRVALTYHYGRGKAT